MTASSKLFFRAQSYYSFGFGSLSIKRLVDDAKALGCDQLILADYNNLHGAVEFYEYAKSEKITPIIGMTCFIEEPQKKGVPRGSVTLIAKNYSGFCEIGKISYNISASKEDYMPLEAILGHDNAFIVINNAKYLCSYANAHTDVFYNTVGDDGNVGFEVNENKKVHMPLYTFGYVKDIQNAILLQAKNEKKTLKYKKNKHGQIAFENEKDFCDYLRGLGAFFPDYGNYASPNEIKNMELIFSQCSVDLKVPIQKIPFKTDKNPALIIKEKYTNFLNNKKDFIGNIALRDKYFERANFELSVLEKTSFCKYFLLVEDIIEYAKSQNIFVGIGRGSVVGCLIAYCLGITGVDPLEYNLLFERFMTPDRVSPPDIDIDFEAGRREEIKDYIKKKYGSDYVATIININFLKGKSAFKDVARIFEIDPKLSQKIADLIVAKVPKTIENVNVTAIKYSYDNFIKLRNEAKKNPTVAFALSMANKLEKIPSHISTHASGVIISNRPLEKIIPLIENEKMMLTQYNGKTVENFFGILKVDCLNLHFLDMIKDICSSIACRKGFIGDEKNEYIKKIYERIFFLCKNDKASYNIFKKGLTLGIFQFEGNWVTRVIKRFKPNKIDDLVAITAICRPSTAGWIDHFCTRREGKHSSIKNIEDQKRFDMLSSIADDNKDIKDLLIDTGGVPIYQEQIIKLVQYYAGFSLSEADMLRRIISKKDENDFYKIKERFLQKAKEKGRYEAEANFIFDDIIHNFCSYGFNKSHAVAYAFLGVCSAYFKAHFPTDFYIALINSKDYKYLTGEMGDRLIDELSHFDIKIINPHFSVCSGKTTATENNIFLGASIIKSVNKNLVNSLSRHYENRRDEIFYKDAFANFCETFLVPKYICIEGTIKKGFYASSIIKIIEAGFFHGSEIKINNDFNAKLSIKAMCKIIEEIFINSNRTLLEIYESKVSEDEKIYDEQIEIETQKKALNFYFVNWRDTAGKNIDISVVV